MASGPAVQAVHPVQDALQHASASSGLRGRAAAGLAGWPAGCSASSATLVKPPWVMVPITSMIRP